MDFVMPSRPQTPPIRMLCQLYHFSRGIPSPLDLATSFGELKDENSHARLLAVASTRASLGKLMASGTTKSIIPRTEPATPAAELLATIDAYTPLVLQLALSVEADPEAVRLHESFIIEWPSPLTRLAVKVKVNRSATGAHVRGALCLEAAMLLASRGFLLADDARATLGPACSGDVKVASERLRAAAGVFSFLLTKVENEWSAPLAAIVQVEQRPHETIPSVLKALRDLALAQAQGMAVAQVVKQGAAAASPTMLAKLCHGAATLLDAAAQQLATSPNAKVVTGLGHKSDVGGTLTDYLTVWTCFWRALAHRYTAADLWAKEQWGDALAHQRTCVALAASKGLQPPQLLGQLKEVAEDVAGWRSAEEATLSSYESDNNTIYFAAVPLAPDPLPPAAFVAKPTLMQEPEVAPICLHRTGDHVADDANDSALAAALAESAIESSDGGPDAAAEGASLPDFEDAVGMGEGANSAAKPGMEPPPPPSYEEAAGTSKPAAAGSAEGTAAATRLTEMGFTAQQVATALKKHNGREAAALEALLSGT